MKFYIPFGDWSDDGHGKCEKVLVEAPSMEGLLEAEKRIKEQYGSKFFDEFADEYEDSALGESVVEALKDRNYPNIENVNETFEGEDGEHRYNDIDTVIDCFIFLLNSYGAEITRYENIPEINNWTCKGFETVGYGCFE